jgi:hypothetical protein
MRRAVVEPAWAHAQFNLWSELPITIACLGFPSLVGIFRPSPDERRTACFGGLRAQKSRIYHPSEPRGHPLT